MNVKMSIFLKCKQYDWSCRVEVGMTLIKEVAVFVADQS